MKTKMKLYGLACSVGEHSLTDGVHTPTYFPPSNLLHTPLGILTPEMKTEEDEIAESMVKPLLVEGEDKFKDKKEEEEKTISTDRKSVV